TKNNRPNNNANSNNRVTQNKDNRNQTYFALIAKKLTGAIVQGDEDKLSIVEIENEYISIEDRRVPIQNYRQYKEGIQNNNLKKIHYMLELDIKKRPTENSKLEEKQQARIKELLEENKDLFAEGLI
ncbi:20839_t:CDS:2, partial [Gigaspora margarita]